MSDGSKNRFDVWTLGFSPICTGELYKALAWYTDRKTATLLSSGFRYGFKLHYEGLRLPFDTTNLKSVIQNKTAAKKW